MGRIFTDTMKRLFPRDFEELEPYEKRWWQKIDFSCMNQKKAMWIYIGILVLILPSIYYFNKFIDLATNTETAYQQVEVQLQRRKDLLISLTTTVVDYAEHERTMMKYMADTHSPRGAAKAELAMKQLKESGLMDLLKSKGGAISGGALSKLLALGEAYPDLKLSNNFQKLMDALIATEDRIAQQRTAYNDKANAYGTYVDQIPNCIYGFLLGYNDKKYPYITIDSDVDEYKHAKY